MSLSSDQFWKILSIMLGCLVMPLAGWVWTVNVEVAQLRNDMGDLEQEVSRLEADVEEHEEASRTLIRVERELNHVRDILGRIEALVTQ